MNKSVKEPWKSTESLRRAKSSVQQQEEETKKPQPPAKASQQTASIINKKKPEHGKVELDLLEMAMQAQRLQMERKRSKSQALPPPPASAVPVKIGKVRGAGELARRKNRLTSLKKSIVIDRRRAEIHLSAPGNASHPSLLGFDCVWLPAEEEEEFDAATTCPVFYGAYFKQTAVEPAPPTPRPTVRDYITQALSPKLDEVISQMLEKLFRFQERARLEDATKAKLRRRLVLGLREVKKGCKTKKCIAVVITPNIDSLGQLDSKVDEILHLCRNNPTRQEFEEEIPILFTGLSKLRLGKCLGISRPVSVIGVFSADGAHEEFKLAVQMASKLSTFWHSQIERETTQAKQRGTRPWCLNCLAPLEDLARRTCLQCESSFCQSCCDSLQSRRVFCVARSDSLCDIVRISRAELPVLGEKPKISISAPEFIPQKSATKLSVSAKEFVPAG